MNRSGKKLNPGARIFGNALASITVSSRQQRSKSKIAIENFKEQGVSQKGSSLKYTKLSESYVPVSSLVHEEPYTDCASNLISGLSADDDDYSLPVMQSIPNHPGAYTSSDVYSPFYSSTSNQSGSSVYSFTLSSLPNDPSGLPSDISSSVCGAYEDDYRLPLTLPRSSPDSGYPSSEDGSSSGTSSPEYNMEESMSYYHMINSSKSPSEEKHQFVPTTSEVRVNRRILPRIQGKRTSTSTVAQISKSFSMLKKDLPGPFPEYTFVEDSGAEVSTDEDPPIDGCKTCEKESEEVRRDDFRSQWGSLPDYSRLDFLTFKTNVGFIDSHCHLDFLFARQNYEGTYTDYMRMHRDTYPATYEGCVAVFCNPRTFHKKLMLQRYLSETNVWGAFGCHPKNASAYSDVVEDALCSALLHSKVRALGEIGLDYSNGNGCSKETQHNVFRRQLKIALSRKLPLVIHCRDAYEDCMAIMKEVLPRSHPIHLHCFTGSWSWAQKWMSAFPNLCIGLTNLVTYASARPTHQVAKRIPLDRLLLETDAPYFVPRMSPRSTKWSHPGMAIHVAAQIATLRNLPLREIIHRTRQNTKKVYGI